MLQQRSDTPATPQATAGQRPQWGSVGGAFTFQYRANTGPVFLCGFTLLKEIPAVPG